MTALEPPSLAARLAAEKALAVSRRHPAGSCSAPTRCSPATAQVFHKPADRDAAQAQLQAPCRADACPAFAPGAWRMDGQVVECVLDAARISPCGALTDEAIDALSRRSRARTCSEASACYQVEGLGIHLFERSRAITRRSWACRCCRFSPPCAVSAAWLSRTCVHDEGLRRRPPDQAFALAADPRPLAAAATGSTAPMSASTWRRWISRIS